MNKNKSDLKFLLAKYGDNVAGLIGYGSMLFGRTRKSSVFDCWIILKDPKLFHERNEELYKHRLNKPSNPAEQIRLNQEWINFYAVTENGIDMKWAVVSENDFVRFCRDKWMFVKGRMQKPLKIFRSTKAIEEAILDARREATRQAVDLLNSPFSLDDFLRMAMSLSYMADIRPESIRVKVSSIIESARGSLHKIYRPLLQELDYIKECEGVYKDTRPDNVQRKAWLQSRWYLWKAKFHLGYRKVLWRNYRTYNHPLWYVFYKIYDEMMKRLKYNILARLSKRVSIKQSVDENLGELAGILDFEVDDFLGSEIKKIGKGTYRVSLNLGTEKRMFFVEPEKLLKRMQTAYKLGIAPQVLFVDHMHKIIFVEDLNLKGYLNAEEFFSRDSIQIQTKVKVVQALGAAFRELHGHRMYHSDPHAHNIFINVHNGATTILDWEDIFERKLLPDYMFPITDNLRYSWDLCRILDSILSYCHSSILQDVAQAFIRAYISEPTSTTNRSNLLGILEVMEKTELPSLAKGELCEVLMKFVNCSPDSHHLTQ